MSPHHLRLITLFVTLATLGLLYFPWCKRKLRYFLQCGSRLFLRMLARPFPNDPLPKILIIAPHPDDESLGCGGLIACSRLAGIEVHIVFVTDGQASHPGHPTLVSEVLIRRRRAEVANAMQSLGMDSACVYFLGEVDGTLSTEGADISRWSRQLADIVETVQPSKVLLPCRADGSSEHEAVFAGAAALVTSCTSQPLLVEYPVWAWRQPLRLFEAAMKANHVQRYAFPGYGFLKQRAVACHKTQTEPQPPWEKAVLDAGFLEPFQAEEEFYFVGRRW